MKCIKHTIFFLSYKLKLSRPTVILDLDGRAIFFFSEKVNTKYRNVDIFLKIFLE